MSPSVKETTALVSTPLPVSANSSDEIAITILFRCGTVLIILLNVIDGVLPASLVAINREMVLDYSTAGALGGLVYLGLVVSSFLAGPVLQKYSIRKTLAFACALEGMFCIGFGMSPYTPILLISRFGVGFFMGFISVFAPVWVDEFAPKERQTMWMSFLQLATPLGIMLGYAIGIVVSSSPTINFYEGWGMWRVPFVMQGALIVPLSLCILLVPEKYLKKEHHDYDDLDQIGSVVATPRRGSYEAPSPERALSTPSGSSLGSSFGTIAIATTPIIIAKERSSVQPTPRTHRQGLSSSIMVGGVDTHVPRPHLDGVIPGFLSGSSEVEDFKDSSKKGIHRRSLFEQVLLILKNKVFVLTVLGLAALYFVVTGIQFWITQYLVLDLGGDVGVVGAWFVFCSATGPTAGVIVGGQLIDRWGGYQGKGQAAIALRFCLGFVVVAVGSCMVVAFGDSLQLVIPFVWLMLFAGGAIVPAATGILMSCVHPHLKNLSSAISSVSCLTFRFSIQICFNILGYFLSPTLSGYVMNLTSRQWGFRMVMFWSGFGAIFLFFAWMYDYIL